MAERKKSARKPRWVQEKYPPIGFDSCAVPFDPHSGCAVSVERNLTGELSLIGLTFVTEYDQTLPNDLSLTQAEALVVAVSEVIRQARAGE